MFKSLDLGIQNWIHINFFQNAFVAMSCLLAVATATPHGYYQEGQTYVFPAAVTFGSGSTYVQPAYVTYGKPTAFSGYSAPTSSSMNGLFGYDRPLSSDSKDLISAGMPRLTQAMAKLNELSTQLPTYLANVSPQTRSDIVKVNGIVNNVCARAMSEINPNAYSNIYTPQGLKEMCAYIAKVGSDIVAGLDNPSIFQKYTNDLQTAVTALNGNAADLVL